MSEKEYKPLKGHQKFYLLVKRLIDIFGSFIGILLLSLPMIIVAIITRCSSKGPAIFKHKRYGKNLKVFNCLKFRSMRADAPIKAPSDMSKDEQQSMVTKWGKFMRKCSIDEWPQLFNIFVGQMSFVGPRPGSANNEEELKEFRLSQEYNPYAVRPGLTGYAQVWMKREHDAKEKAWFDSEYVKKISLWFDTKLFIRSFIKPGKGN